MSLAKVPTIDKFPVVASQWGIKPKGFENVTAQRAKLSGLFPLPGSPRPVDMTKLEGLMKEGSNENGVLLATSKIDPLDSRSSCIVIVEGIDFTKVDFIKLADYINKFLCSADLEGTAVDNNLVRKWKNKDDSTLILELKSSVASTLALALSGKSISADQVAVNDQGTNGEVTLLLRRPGEYVVQCLPPYGPKVDEIEDKVVDSPRKITILIDKNVTESVLSDALAEIAPLRAIKLVREIGTKDPTGIAFAEFFVDPKEFPSTKNAVKQISTYIDQVRKLEFVTGAWFSCIELSDDGKVETSIQDCPIDVKTLKALVRNEYVPFHPKQRVIQLFNLVTPNDLVDDASFKFIENDILEEARTFGQVVSIKIPRPPHDYSPGILQLTNPGIGKVFLEFDSEETALAALMGMGGRSYNDRTVLCAFYDHQDFSNGLL